MHEPIKSYAAVGDGRSVALVSRRGAVDWLCWPRFDSPPVFGALLDPRAGTWRIAPAAPARVERRYLAESNVLETTFATDGGVLRVTDFMPARTEEEKLEQIAPDHELVRIVECRAGEVEVEVTFDPRPRFPERARLERRGALGWFVRAGGSMLALRGEEALEPRAEGGLRVAFRLRGGESRAFSLSMSDGLPAVLPPLGDAARDLAGRTTRFWRAWIGRMRYAGPHRDAVARSALALKLLGYAPSGAIVASPTTSLPERPGGDLNWDYRYCWLRDASFTVRVLFGLGYEDEADAFVSWLLYVTRLTRGTLSVLYDVYGKRPTPERDLVAWSGYGGARPVRRGNDAEVQVQLDVYGEVIDAAAQRLRRGGALDRATARFLVALGDHVCTHWRQPDAGIWEPRVAPCHHTHSRLLCWVAVDRLVGLCDEGHLDRRHRDRFAAARAAIRLDIERHAYSPALGAYSAVLDGYDVDASLLLLARYGFEDPTSPRMRRTYERVVQQLRAGEDLLYRYRNGQSPGEGAFAVCSFWEVGFLARAGRAAEARALFERVMRYANDLGLLGEEIDPATGDALGNFPLALTHVGVVHAALAMEKYRERGAGAVHRARRREKGEAAPIALHREAPK